MFQLQVDFDEWDVEKDFGSGVEKYRVRYLHADKFDELSSKFEDDTKRDESLLDYALVDWFDSVLGEKGKKVPCTKKNKIAFMRTSKRRSLFILMQAQIGETNKEKLIEDIVGNLQRPSGTNSRTNGAKPSRQTVASV